MERIGELGLDELIARARRGRGAGARHLPRASSCCSSPRPSSAARPGSGCSRAPSTGLEAEGLKVPHIGWEPVALGAESELIEGIADGTPFYFVHSFAPRPKRAADLLGTAVHGERFACAIARPPVYGVQFHPEKSSAAGLRAARQLRRRSAPRAVARA